MADPDDLGAGFVPERILAALVHHGVDFVVIGGIAAVLHGGELKTGDVDVVHAMGDENLRNLGAALEELDARSIQIPGLSTDHLARLLSGAVLWRWHTRFGDFDMMASASGAPRGYEGLKPGAVSVNVDDFDVLVAGVDDLIAMKRTTGRAKDVAKLAELEALRTLRAQMGLP